MDKISFKILTPEGVVFDDKISYLKVTTPSGDQAFLSQHEDFIAVLKDGNIRFKKGEEYTDFATVGGTVFFENDNVVILSQFAAEPKKLAQIVANRVDMLSKVYDDDIRSETELQKAEMALRRFLLQKGNQGGGY